MKKKYKRRKRTGLSRLPKRTGLPKRTEVKTKMKIKKKERRNPHWKRNQEMLMVMVTGFSGKEKR